MSRSDKGCAVSGEENVTVGDKGSAVCGEQGKTTSGQGTAPRCRSTRRLFFRAFMHPPLHTRTLFQSNREILHFVQNDRTIKWYVCPTVRFNHFVQTVTGEQCSPYNTGGSLCRQVRTTRELSLQNNKCGVGEAHEPPDFGRFFAFVETTFTIFRLPFGKHTSVMVFLLSHLRHASLPPQTGTQNASFRMTHTDESLACYTQRQTKI